jgi:hypothetical protein
VAIYGKAEPKFKTEQIGTGFLVAPSATAGRTKGHSMPA